MIRNLSIRMLLAVLLLAGGWIPPCRAESESDRSTLAQWRYRLDALIGQPRFKNGQWGIKVVSLDTGKTLFEHNAHKFFQPASNAKLFTAAMVLDRLGSDCRIPTYISSVARPDADGVLHGDVYVSGQGDPTLSSRWHDGDAKAALDPLVAVFRKAGVRRIEGDLIGDESFLHRTTLARGWMWEDLEYAYGAPLSALSFDDNTVKLHVSAASTIGKPCQVAVLSSDTRLKIVNETVTTEADAPDDLSAKRPLGTDTVIVSGQIGIGSEKVTLSVPVPSPARFFMDNLAAELRRGGITIAGKIGVRSAWESGGGTRDVLGSVQSPTMAGVLGEALKESDNLAAALLFAHAEARLMSEWSHHSKTSGPQLLNQFLAEAGLPADEVQIEEGSGLSRNNLTTPNAIVALLLRMHDHQSSADFVAALPIAGVDGTLKGRFKDTPAQGKLRAKTGTLRWAQALSGYVTSQAGEELAFSILLNRYLPAESAPAATEEIDAVALHIASLSGS